MAAEEVLDAIALRFDVSRTGSLAENLARARRPRAFTHRDGGIALQASTLEVEAVSAARARDGVRVSVPRREGAWLRVLPDGADGHATREVVDGLVVYPRRWMGADAIYLPDEERVEEWLHLRAASAASAVRYEVETGPAIAGLRVDGSGAGLEAYDAHGSADDENDPGSAFSSRGRDLRGRSRVS